MFGLMEITAPTVPDSKTRLGNSTITSEEKNDGNLKPEQEKKRFDPKKYDSTNTSSIENNTGKVENWLASQYCDAISLSPSPNYWSCDKENRLVFHENQNDCSQTLTRKPEPHSSVLLSPNQNIHNQDQTENSPEYIPTKQLPSRKAIPANKYAISPLNTDERDIDLSDDDPTYNTKKDQNTVKRFKKKLISNQVHCSDSRSPSKCNSSSKVNSQTRKSTSSSSSHSSSSTSSSSSSSSSSSNSSSSSTSSKTHTSTEENNTPVVTSRKRKRDTTKWKQNIAKVARNSGQAYTSCSKTKRKCNAHSMKPPCSQKCRLKCSEQIDEDMRLSLFKKYWELKIISLQWSYINTCMTEITPKYHYSNAENPRGYNHAFYFTVNSRKI
ncbi:unnamed protein product [Diatraea saccharalis]|uniref:Uncharacterized protein n=1 Tax=Diatraea saccharalis TaxID=40085 RepID=A0A9N9R625_9NEOP|nr:unnamed protein product [Diatraea saccharalis]